MEIQSYLLGKKAGGGSGTTNYSDLSNKPSINSVELSGNKSSSDLGLQDTLVSGTNIKSINNTSLLGSGNITVGGAKYVINVSGSDGNYSNFDTTANKQVFKEIYDNYSNVNASDVFLKDEDGRLYNVENIMLLASPNRLYIYLTIPSAGKYAGFSKDFYANFECTFYSTFSNGDAGTIYLAKSQRFLADNTDFITYNNSSQYTPTQNYHPATKKYVDDQVGTINTILATLTTPGGNA